MKISLPLQRICQSALQYINITKAIFATKIILMSLFLSLTSVCSWIVISLLSMSILDVKPDSDHVPLLPYNINSHIKHTTKDDVYILQCRLTDPLERHWDSVCQSHNILWISIQSNIHRHGSFVTQHSENKCDIV